jgi:hypothetical protein
MMMMMPKNYIKLITKDNSFLIVSFLKYLTPESSSTSMMIILISFYIILKNAHYLDDIIIIPPIDILKCPSKRLSNSGVSI